MPHQLDTTALLRELFDLDRSTAATKQKSRALAEKNVQIEALRSRLPTSILNHYDNRRARGKLPIAAVNSKGVCGSCHLSMPKGNYSDLKRGGVVQVCGNCGAFIFPIYEETGTPPEPVTTKPPRKSKKTIARTE